MKWLLLCASIFFKPFSRFSSSSTMNPAVEIKQFFVDNAKKVLLAFIASSIISSMFVAGLIISIITISAQYDQNGGIGLSAMLLGGIGMVVLSLIFGWAILSPSRESRSVEHEIERAKKEEHLSGNTVSDALVLLIQDFVKEREFKRSTAQSFERAPEESYYARPESTEARH